jgi:hypothetical protein
MVDGTESRIVVLDATLGDTSAERNLRRELGPETVVYKMSEGAFHHAPRTRRCRRSTAW